MNSLSVYSDLDQKKICSARPSITAWSKLPLSQGPTTFEKSLRLYARRWSG